MRPKVRYMQGNAGSEGPTSLLFFDTESHEPTITAAGTRRELRMRLWTACYVRREGDTFREPIYHHGKTAEAFWRLVDHYSDWRRPLWAFAHNIGFDLTQLDFWSQLEARRYTPGPIDRPPDPETGKPKKPWHGHMCLEGRPTYLIVRGRRGTVKLVDTGNYWPTKLEAVGERFGLEKLPMPAWSAPDADWLAYCRRDVDVCRVAVCELLRWWLAEDCGVFKLTAPALALTNFQHTCKVRAKNGEAVGIVLEDDSPARPMERAAYLGGRVEPFYLGPVNGPIHALDCNSLYLSCMAGELYPTKRLYRLVEPSPELLARRTTCLGAVADVQVNTGASDDTYPVRTPAGQVHACGRFWTTLCGPELRRALTAGHVERVGEAHLYRLAELFRGWAEDWYARKQAAKVRGDLGEYEFAKLIGLSLAGKFGQRGEWWVDAPERGPRHGWGRTVRCDDRDGSVVHYRYVGGHTQKKTPGTEPANAFPLISAYVTAYARERMRSAFRDLPPFALLYSATDSIVTTAAGYKALQQKGWVSEDKLGHFRLEGTHREAEICGPNHYRVGDRWTFSGWHGRAKRNAKGDWECEVWDHLGDLLGRNPRGVVGIQTVTLRELLSTQKNDPAGGGWRRPFRLTADHEFTDVPRRGSRSDRSAGQTL